MFLNNHGSKRYQIDQGGGDMKKAILLGCLLLCFVSTVWAQEKCDAPLWNVGDKWTFKRADGVTLTNEVIEIKQDSYILKTGGSLILNGYDKNSMNIKFSIEGGGKQVESDNFFRKLFDFPISVGKKWGDVASAYPGVGITKMGKILYDLDYKVEGIEEISTPAGKFKAYKIQYNQTNRNSKRSGGIRFWYSPEVKNWMKREAEKKPFWGEQRNGKGCETHFL